MLYLAMQRSGGRRILAGRNAHKTFLSAAALLDLDVTWLCTDEGSYLSCPVTAETLERALLTCGDERPAAVYLTSPDYLGNTVDVQALSGVCHRYGTLLLVDNAHGAYLRFLPQSRHPMDLGADLCCDSAHKTLPVLTGGAYLHVADPALAANAKNALALFGSTSPSYLILQSLDAANRYLADGYAERLEAFLIRLAACRSALTAHGYRLLPTDETAGEPMKLTLDAKAYGYTGRELSDALYARGIVCEFADPDLLVLMPTPELGEEGIAALERALTAIPQRPARNDPPPRPGTPARVLSVRQATLSRSETVPAGESLGRVLALASVGCPPAVPIVVSGERIDEAALRCFAYYGIETCTVVAE
jgi:arginine/lysine/ornithine decarboxylase